MDDPVVILDQVKTCLDSWAIDVGDITLASQSENIVYRVTTSTGAQYAFRIHRPGYHSFEELVSEHEWTDALIKAGFPLPNAIPTVDGEFYVPVKVNGGTRYAGLIEWIEGESLQALIQENSTTEFLCSALEKVGQLMAKLHEHSIQWQHGENFVRHKFDVDGFFGASPFWGRYWESPYVDGKQQQLLLSSQRNIAQTLTTLGYTSNVFGMIHGDLHHGNLFFSRNKMHIIDFDDAGFGWYLYDIAVALFEYQSRADFSDVCAALLRGYEKVSTLTNDHRSLIPMFMHIRSRAIIGWATARPELDNADSLKKLVHHTCREALAYR